MASLRQPASAAGVESTLTHVDTKDLKPGDLLRFPRKGYSHWAVYMGKLDDGRCVVGHIWRDKTVSRLPRSSASASYSDSSSSAMLQNGARQTTRQRSSRRRIPIIDDGLLRGKSNKVVLSPLEDVGEEWFLANSHYDKKFNRPLPRNDIVKRVHNRLGERSYSLVFHNCEHFATWYVLRLYRF